MFPRRQRRYAGSTLERWSTVEMTGRWELEGRGAAGTNQLMDRGFLGVAAEVRLPAAVGW